jgi:putative endonuclease
VKHDQSVKDRRFYVYIMASRSHNLYIGVTNDLGRRVCEHKSHEIEGFTARYNVDRLVWFGEYDDIRRAITREKQLKRWVRKKKV